MSDANLIIIDWLLENRWILLFEKDTTLIQKSEQYSHMSLVNIQAIQMP